MAESTGTIASISPETWYGYFSNSNSPLAGSGANLPGNHVGQISLVVGSGTYYGRASIYWDSSTCGPEPILASVESVYHTSSKSGISVQLVNDGKPF